MIEALGYISGILLATCAIPLAIQVCHQRHADSLSWAFLVMWLAGEIGTSIYTLVSIGWNGPLQLNYIINVVCIVLILRYKL